MYGMIYFCGWLSSYNAKAMQLTDLKATKKKWDVNEWMNEYTRATGHSIGIQKCVLIMCMCASAMVKFVDIIRCNGNMCTRSTNIMDLDMDVCAYCSLLLSAPKPIFPKFVWAFLFSIFNTKKKSQVFIWFRWNFIHKSADVYDRAFFFPTCHTHLLFAGWKNAFYSFLDPNFPPHSMRFSMS